MDSRESVGKRRRRASPGRLPADAADRRVVGTFAAMRRVAHKASRRTLRIEARDRETLLQAWKG